MDCIICPEGTLSPPAAPHPSERPSQKPREGLLVVNRNLPINVGVCISLGSVAAHNE